jgi:hypothetical protein
MPPFAEIVDLGALMKVVAASFIAGAGLTFGYSVVILSATRAAELRREGSGLGAGALWAVALVAVLACLGLVAFGINIMVSK